MSIKKYIIEKTSHWEKETAPELSNAELCII